MAEYTKGEDRLHMAYSFDMLGPQFTAAHFRSRVERFFSGAPDGWPCWAFSNHDVIRHVTRWSDAGPQDAVARLSAALLLSLQGRSAFIRAKSWVRPKPTSNTTN